MPWGLGLLTRRQRGERSPDPAGGAPRQGWGQYEPHPHPQPSSGGSAEQHCREEAKVQACRLLPASGTRFWLGV